MLQESERFILMDWVPQQVYGRMRMCRAMVNDHFTPAYLSAMTRAVASFEAGYPAKCANLGGADALGHQSKSAAACGADTLMGGRGFQGPGRSMNGTQTPAYPKRNVSGLARLGTGPDSHAKAA